MKRSDKCRKGSDELKEVQKNHYESVMKESMRGRPDVTSLGVEIRIRRLYPEGEVLKAGKASCIDGITTEMLKYDVTVGWMM